MAKQNIKDPGAHHNSSGALIRRFYPIWQNTRQCSFSTCSVLR